MCLQNKIKLRPHRIRITEMSERKYTEFPEVNKPKRKR